MVIALAMFYHTFYVLYSLETLLHYYLCNYEESVK